jgi:hypothetical protein
MALSIAIFNLRTLSITIKELALRKGAITISIAIFSLKTLRMTIKERGTQQRRHNTKHSNIQLKDTQYNN